MDVLRLDRAGQAGSQFFLVVKTTIFKEASVKNVHKTPRTINKANYDFIL